MTYLFLIILVLYILVIKRLLDINSLWLKLRKNDGVLRSKSSLDKKYQFIKNLY